MSKGKDTLFKIKFAKCTDCHKDEHQGQFASAPYFNRCEQCHTLEGYHPSTFSLGNHKQTRFQLTGGHLAIACADCHKERSTPQFEKIVLFRFEDRSCTVCHNDPHKGQFIDRMRQVGADGTAFGCEACHTTAAWNDLRRFDHATTSFPLVGAHRATACIDCHKPRAMETKLLNVDFKAAPTRCEDCHEDIHSGQFANASDVTSCIQCHNSVKWKPSLFDHERAGFSLKGAHERVRCGDCHKTIRQIQGKSVLFYKPTPKDCAACHGPAKTAELVLPGSFTD
jgi:nitrate/TMAO reductase-like tetraheme cytochrome c subunit